MHTGRATLPILCLLALVFLATAPANAQGADPERARCAAVSVGPPVRFHGRVLREIPDIAEPELRRANQMLSAGCLVEVGQALEALADRDPRNIHAIYVQARTVWTQGSASRAESMLNGALARSPDFASARVLLAAIRFEQHRIDDAISILDAVEARSPDDLWIFMNRLRIDALRSPSRDLRSRLLEIAANAEFPVGARYVAAQTATTLPDQTPAEYKEDLRAQIGVDPLSPYAVHPVLKLALQLSEDEGDFAATRALLESPAAVRGQYLREPMLRLLLAEATLMEAAKISAGPSAANAALVRRVDRLLNGDYTRLADWVMSRPQGKVLAPFVRATVHPAETDRAGRTAICNAVLQLNAEAVREQLEAGADPNGACGDGGETLVGYLVYMATREQVPERRAVLRELLSHGAKPVRVDVCRSPDVGDCREVLLPLLEQYSR